ncbi:hypothetical protein NP233_g2142 [Leucocoprinus birnbaumii]|uniref:Uncharacterized protein n=1 Tax=Leucocoprinus birnbaumii TaxID=56174 RepID=A0AAD5W4W1_9AGAR|nr:hypothetical protein NP233_g2142 [Leucocoprinus birnbaumii]
MQDEGQQTELSSSPSSETLASNSAYIFKSSHYMPTDSDLQPPWLSKRPKLSSRQLFRHSDGAKDVKFELEEQRRVTEIFLWPPQTPLSPSPAVVPRQVKSLEQGKANTSNHTRPNPSDSEAAYSEADYFCPREKTAKSLASHFRTKSLDLGCQIKLAQDLPNKRTKSISKVPSFLSSGN